MPTGYEKRLAKIQAMTREERHAYYARPIEAQGLGRREDWFPTLGFNHYGLTRLGEGERS